MNISLLKAKVTITLFVCLCIAVCNIPAAVFADTDNNVYDKNDLLVALDIIPSAENGDETVTRGYLARVMTGLMGVVPSGYSESADIYDVTEETEYAPYIITAYEVGYVKRAVAGKFLPDRAATAGEIARAAVIVCGYDAIVENKTSAEYLTAAYSLKLLKGSYDKITKRDLWSIALNCLDTKVPYVTYKAGTNKTDLTNKTTLLEETFGCYEGTGIITANGVTSLSEAYNKYRSSIRIDGIEMKCDNPHYGEYLGMRCKYIYRTSSNADGEYELVWVKPVGNETVSITGRSNPSYSEGVLVYDENGQTKKCRFSSSGDIIYNGQAFGGLDDPEWNERQSDITLIDNNSDGVFDVAFVNTFRNYKVRSVNIDRAEILAFTEGSQKNSVVLKLEQANKTGLLDIYDKNGKITLNDISADNIISVFTSKSGYTLIAVENSYSETVISEVDDDKLTVTCKGAEFGCYGTEPFKNLLGKEVILYLDAYSNAAFAEEIPAENERIGYLIAADFDLFKNEARVRLLESNGALSVYELADTYQYNDQTKRLSRDGIAPFWDKNKPTSENESVVLFTLDKSKKIKAIEVPDPESTDGLRESFPRLERVYRPNGKSFLERRDARGAIRKIPINCAIADNCVFFVIPRDGTDPEDYSVGSTDLFTLNQWVDITGYSTSKAKRIDIAVINGGNAAAESNWKNYGMVTDVYLTWDEGSDCICYKVVFADGTECMIDDSYDETVAKAGTLSYGDFIRYYKDSRSRISVFSKYFDALGMTSLHDEDEALGAMRTIYGTVTDVTDSLVTIAGDNGVEYVENIYFARNKLYRVNVNRKICEKLSAENITMGDKILLISSDEVMAYGIVFE